MSNLLERAFNLNPTQPGQPILTDGTGTSGLPLVRATDGPGGRVFSIQYVRHNGNPSPLAAINTSNLAIAATVYQDTPATVRAGYQGFTGTLDLTVLNVNNDDYGSYAGDAVPDDWQVQYFGLNNPNAAPTKDVDSTGQNNLFKYIAAVVTEHDLSGSSSRRPRPRR